LLFLDNHNYLFYSYHQLVTIADKAAVSSGVVQSAVRNYINLNIGEQLGRFHLLLPTPKIKAFKNKSFWPQQIRTRIDFARLDPDPYWES
jgi:hypothetical protein